MFRLLWIFSSLCIVALASNTASLIAKAQRQPRIIGGFKIRIEDAPYEVSIINTTSGRHMCGGSIVSSNYVLTAAHCAVRLPSNYNVRSGSSFSNRDGQIHEVEEIFKHESYDLNFFGVPTNDIALMKVKTPFEIDNVTRKIVTLFDRDQKIQEGESAFVSGWGTLNKNILVASEQLQGLRTKISNHEACDKKYRFYGGVKKNQFCAVHPDNDDEDETKHKGFCDGDSGSPLIIDGRQAGIISWAVDCTEEANVFTEVAGYRDWIDQHISL